MSDEDDKGKPDKAQGAGRKRRKHPRVDFFSPVQVTVPEEDTSTDLFAGNVSRGGIFLRSNRPLPQGKKVSLNFELEQGPVTVEEAEVVWSKEFEPVSIDGTAPGMGIEFRRLETDSRRKIDAFIDEVLGDEQPPPDPPPVQLEPPNGLPYRPVPVSAKRAETELPAEPQPFVPPGAQESFSGDRLRMHLGLTADEFPIENEPPAREEPVPADPPAPPSEEKMAVLSKPPPPRTKLLWFIAFVLLVAAATFFILIWLKPFDSKPRSGAEATDKPKTALAAKGEPAPGGAATPSARAAPEKPKVALPGTSVPTGVAKSQAPRRESLPAGPDRATDSAPADSSDAATADTAKQKTTVAAKRDEEPPARVASDSSGPASLNKPEFRRGHGGWLLTLNASAPVQFRHFILKSPPRLVIDIKQATWEGEQQLESPAPFVKRLRFGKQPEAVRLVLDFSGEAVPEHRVAKGKDRITVTFPR